MATQVIAPREGGGSGCVLVSWKRSVGDSVELGDELGTVETDKATMDILSPGSGVVLSLLYAEGDEIPPLAPVAIVGEEGEDISERLYKGTEYVPDAAEAPQPQLVKMAARKTVKCTPKAKKYVREHGITLEGIVGTGVDGSICFRDVSVKAGLSLALAARALAAGSDASMPQAGTGIERCVAAPDIRAKVPDAALQTVPLQIRRGSAKRVMQTLHHTAQFTLHSEANADAVVKLRSRFKSSDNTDARRITIGDLLMFAAARVLSRHPALNAELKDGMLMRHEAVDLAFTLDTPTGLAVPVIRGAEKLSLRELSRQAAELIVKGRGGGLDSAETSGGSFTVSNLGSMGITYFTSILNPPQVGLLGIGRIRPLPVCEGSDFRLENTVMLSLTVDHQAVDGTTGARFLSDLSDFIRDFDLLAIK